MMQQRDTNWTEGDDPGERLEAALDKIKSRCATRTTLDRWWLTLYGGLGYQGYTTSQLTPEELELDDSVATENVIRQVADTILSKVLKDDIQPRALTQDGDYEQREKAANLDQWIQGQFAALGVNDEIVPKATLLSLVNGTGLVYTWHDGEQPVCEAQPAWEMHVDPAEAQYGRPGSIYRERRVPRWRLERDYPGIEIPATTPAAWDAVLESPVEYYDTGDDVVRTVEGWSLPYKGTPGRYVLSAGGVTLVDAEWTLPRFPFSVLRYKARPIGFWGQGIVEDLAGAQITMNAAQISRLDAIAKMSAPFILAQRGSNIVESHLLSTINARLVEYGGGAAPQIVTPNAISPGLTTVVSEMRQQMYALAGVSEGSATMQMPARLESGTALRTYHDLGSERLSQLSKQIEAFVLDIARMLVSAAKDLALTTDVPDVTAVAHGASRIIKWKRVDIDEDKYVLALVPASALATTFSGRLQDATDFAKLGITKDPRVLLSLLRLPDIEHMVSNQLSSRRLLERIIEDDILRRGNYWSPEPTWDLKDAAEIVTKTLARAQLDNAPEDRLNLLRAFESEVNALLQQAATPAPQAAPAPGPGAAVPTMPGAESIEGGGVTAYS